jgi:iron-sulfur cluster assembly accessory protein
VQRVLQSPPFAGLRNRLSRWYDASQMEVQERPTQEVVDPVYLTPSAADKIRSLMAEETDVSVLRVAIEGGGCSGFQYGLGFDHGAQEGDLEFECEGVKVVVDPFSAPYLRGARVDYLETIQESGFKIDNPNAVSSCGCGHSFQVADDADPGTAEVGGCGSGCSA